MNKVECKKYLKKAFNSIKAQNKSITINNLENEMKNIINCEINLYIAYIIKQWDNYNNKKFN